MTSRWFQILTVESISQIERGVNAACGVPSLHFYSTTASPVWDESEEAGGARPDRSPLHQRADIIPLCNVFLTLNGMEHILSCYINQIVMLNVLS